MANTFTKTTKASLSTADVTSSTATNIVTVVSGATLVVLSILVSNKTGTGATASIYLVPASGDAVFFIKNAPVPTGSTLEIISGNKLILNSGDVIRASSGTASALDITVSYLQQT